MTAHLKALLTEADDLIETFDFCCHIQAIYAEKLQRLNEQLIDAMVSAEFPPPIGEVRAWESLSELVEVAIDEIETRIKSQNGPTLRPASSIESAMVSNE